MQGGDKRRVSLRGGGWIMVLIGVFAVAACRNHSDEMVLVGYDLDIASEANGDPVQHADKSWADHWLYILSFLERGGSQGGHRIQHYELWVRYIVACRRVAGLPDLPGYSSIGVYPPLGGCNASGVVSPKGK
jgi:hypothetical protein